MKKLALILLILVSLALPLRAHAQSVNWVTLLSDTTSLTAPGQRVQLTLSGSLDTSINGAALILSYDPSCFKVTGHQPGSLIPGATAFVQEQPGQLDLTYYYQGAGKGLTGEGSLITIQLETLQLCDSNLSAAPETITLGVLDDKGIAFNLPGVEHRSLVVHLAPGAGLAVFTPQPLATATATPVAVSIPATAGTTAPAVSPTVTWLFLGILSAMLAIIFIAIIFFMLRGLSDRPAQDENPTQTIPTPGRQPALIHAGRPLMLPNQRTQLGRHVEIIQRDGAFYLTDTGSERGVFLNSNRIGAGYYPLHHGDQIQLGQEVSYQFVELRTNNTNA